MRLVKFIVFIVFISLLSTINAQFSSKVDYQSPKQYTIAGIVVDGVRNFDHNLIIQKSTLVRGKTLQIPGEEISNAIRNLWKENLFSDIKVYAEKIQGSDVFLVIKLKERERLSRYSFKGISKSEGDNLREDLDLYSGKIVTEDLLFKVKQTSRNYFGGKGFLHAKVIINTQYLIPI